MLPRIESGDQVSLISYQAEGRALAVSPRQGGSIALAEVGATASKLIIWRTGFRYERTNVVGYGTGALEAGAIYFGACVSFVTFGDLFLSSPDDRRPLVTDFKNTMPSDSEAFILLNEHGQASETALQYGDVVILRRFNGRYLNCTTNSTPAFRSTTCGAEEKFRVWF